MNSHRLGAAKPPFFFAGYPGATVHRWGATHPRVHSPAAAQHAHRRGALCAILIRCRGRKPAFHRRLNCRERKPPRRAAGESGGPAGGKERAAMYLNAAETRRFNRAIKKDGAPWPSLSSGRLLWLDRGQPATHPCSLTAASIHREWRARGADDRLVSSEYPGAEPRSLSRF